MTCTDMSRHAVFLITKHGLSILKPPIVIVVLQIFYMMRIDSRIGTDSEPDFGEQLLEKFEVPLL